VISPHSIKQQAAAIKSARYTAPLSYINKYKPHK